MYIHVPKGTCLSVKDAIDNGWLRAGIDGARTLLCLVRAHNLLNRELPSPSVKLLLLTELLVWSGYLNYLGKGFSKRLYILSTIQASLYTVDRWCTDHVAVHHVTDYGSVNGVAS